jgi:hypothetical protein
LQPRHGVVAFAFGVPWTIIPNLRIAEIASQLSRELDAPIYTQLDVRPDRGLVVEYAEEAPGSPPPTLRIARGAINWAKQNWLTDLWVVAAKPHLWRALRDVREANKEAHMSLGILCPHSQIDQYLEYSWYAPASTQEHTRSREQWDKRDKVLKKTPFFIYKRIAS